MENNNFSAYNNQAYDHMEGFPSDRRSESERPATIISSQPRSGNGNLSDTTGTRRPIPISVIDRDAPLTSSFQSPSNGLDFMRNADQLIIQQNCNLTDVMADTENRYTVKIPTRENSDAIYYATESSESCHRLCFGSGRAFNMRLYDKTDQEAMSFVRRLGCGYCTFCCRLQRLEVWTPPGELVGTVSQQFQPFQMRFEVKNRHEQILYIIDGPGSFACFHNAEMFQIYTSDRSTQIGTIVHQWDPISVRYQLLLQMPSSITDNRHKALLLGSAFLMEYMFFETSHKKLGLSCFC